MKLSVKANSFLVSHKLLSTFFFVLSFLLILFEIQSVHSVVSSSIFSLTHVFALFSFVLSAYFGFTDQLKTKHPDLIYSVYVLQFVLILFVWLLRFPQ